MDKEDIRNIIKKKTGRIAKLGNAIEKDFETENIHKFRVEVKRLRSFLRLTATVKGNKEIKLPHKFKELYDICGLIREAQLEQKKIEELQLQLPAYSSKLQRQWDEQEKAWKKQYSKHIIDKLEDRLTDHAFNEVKPDVLLKFFNAHCKNIQKLNRNSPDNEDIHSMRKQIKDMLYNTKFAEEEWKDAYKEIADKPLKEMDQLSDSLGDYNDLRIMLDHFEEFAEDSTQEEEQKALLNLCDKKGKMLQNKKEHLIKAIDKFIENMMLVKTA
jgi:CHAD domain-containing protein